MKATRNTAIYLALRALFAAGRLLPLSVLRATGGLIGRAALVLARTDRRRAAEHLRLAFPEDSEDVVEARLAACARHLGHTLGEVVWLWGASAAQVSGLCSMEGEEHLHEARRDGRGAVLITAHAGNWELLNARLGVAGMPMTIAVRELYDPRVGRLATALRARFGADVVARGAAAGRRLATALGRNRVIGLLIDQDIRDIPGVFVPFFGRPAWTPSGAASLALRSGRPCVPAFISRRPDGRHHAVVHPPLPAPGPGTDEERITTLTAAATAAIESQIRAQPEQWVWMHRRWRTRPETS